MTRLYHSEFSAVESITLSALRDSGIPKILWTNYIRLMANNLACQVVEEIHSEQLKTATQ